MTSHWSLFTILSSLILLSACSEREDGTSSNSQEVLSFSANVQTAEQTRAYTGTIDNLAVLKALDDGFGVFAYLTESSLWDAVKATATPDFMYNQSVYWGVQYLDGSTPQYDWVYTPLKYWPNYSNNDNAHPRYVSFFAYAPFTAEGATSGIAGFPDNTDKSPHVTYQIGPIDGAITDAQVSGHSDLMYASCTNARRNDKGLIEVVSSTNTYQKVPLTFHHALSCVDVYVQRVYNEEAFSGNKPAAETNTKLFISKLQLVAGSAMTTKGDLSLLDGSWSNTAGTTTISFSETEFAESIRGTANTGSSDLDKAIVRDSELDKWGKENFGIDERERSLFTGAKSMMMIPQTVTFTPVVTYSMITRDNSLETGYLVDKDDNRYSRIVNTVSGNPVTLTFTKGKRYTLLIHIGVETVEFEVVSIEDWDFPIRFNTDVDDNEKETIEKIVNES